MKKTRSVILTKVFVMGCVLGTQAQVNLKLTALEEEGAYEVSLVPLRTYDFPKEITGSIQVTIKVSRDELFVPGTIFTEVPNLNWMKNNVLEDRAISDSFNYYSYGVEPIGRAVQLKKGEEIKLFSFKTDNRDKLPKVELLDSSDPVISLAERNLSVDIGNNVTIATTMGVSNVYKSSIQSRLSYITTEGGQETVIQGIYPNPATDEVKLEYFYVHTGEKVESLKVQFVDSSTGRVYIEQSLGSATGHQIRDVDIRKLQVGKYVVRLNDEKGVVGSPVQFIKGN